MKSSAENKDSRGGGGGAVIVNEKSNSYSFDISSSKGGDGVTATASLNSDRVLKPSSAGAKKIGGGSSTISEKMRRQQK